GSTLGMLVCVLVVIQKFFPKQWSLPDFGQFSTFSGSRPDTAHMGAEGLFFKAPGPPFPHSSGEGNRT
ncbi:MAG: hypothetical protein MR428_06535, partial [Mesosutterella sp.]|nr:hypothetical protein [Mesosutterella sp.]